MVSCMNKLLKLFLVSLLLAMTNTSHAVDNAVSKLPSWQQLEFERKEFWATARSQLKIAPVAGKPDVWMLDVLSSVVDNS